MKKGGSILFSGAPRSSPLDVLSKKVTISPSPESNDIHKVGLAFSSLRQTGGIYYLFQIFRARIQMDAQIIPLKDHATLVSLAEANAAIAEKPLEVEVMREILGSAA